MWKYNGAYNNCEVQMDAYYKKMAGERVNAHMLELYTVGVQTLLVIRIYHTQNKSYKLS
jgi:hypothetical protein